MHVMKRAKVPCAFEDGHRGRCRTPEGARANRALDAEYDRRRDPLKRALQQVASNAKRRAA